MAICICGTDLAEHLGGGRQKQYCSDACRQRACRKRNEAEIQDWRETIDTSDDYAIYSLTDPRNALVYYIGMSKDVLARLRQHFSCDGVNLEKDRRTREILADGMQPTLSILEIVRGVKAAKRRESYWIAFHLEHFSPLANISENMKRDCHVSLQTLGMLNQIVTGDCRELASCIPDGSIDLIFTDPPYPREYLPLYGWLAKEAARVLKPGGFLLAYTGSVYKFEVMTFLGEHLTYFTDIITLAGKEATPLFQQRLSTRHKSILAFSHGHGLPLCKQMQTTLQGGGKDKRFHKWGQDEQTARYYIECLTTMGQIVWEPFVGGGTTPYVCAQIKRHFIGFEIDPLQADIARTRLATMQMPLLLN